MDNILDITQCCFMKCSVVVQTIFIIYEIGYPKDRVFRALYYILILPMLNYFLAILLVALTHFIYYKVYKPIKQMRQYHKAFTSAGYNFKYQGFVLFGSKVFEYIVFGEKVYGNPNHYMQSVKPNFDGAISSIMNRPVIHIINPDLLQQFFNTSYVHYKKFEKTIQNVKRVIGQGVAFSEGQQWKKKRKIISSAFHFNFLNSLVPHIVETTNRVFDDFDRLSQNTKVQQMDILEQFQKIFSLIMVNLFFGCDTSKSKLDGQEPSLFFLKLVNQINEQSFQIYSFIFGTGFFRLGLRKSDRQINRKVKLFKQFAYNLIKQKISELQRTNFKEGDKKHGNLIEELYLSKSINLQDKSNVDEYDFKELIQEFCTFVVAGTDTTSSLATMMVVYLSKLPDVQKNILEELEKYIKNDTDWTPQNLKQLVYLDACIKETMRMFGPGTGLFLRQAQKPHLFKGVSINQGTLLSPQFLPNNYNAKYFCEPWKFKPQRWFNENSSFGHSFIYTPFSAGKRNCIGQHLSNFEAKVIIGKFLMRYKFQIKEGVRLKFKFLVAPINFKAEVERRDV